MGRQTSNLAPALSWSASAPLPSRLPVGLSAELALPVQFAGRARFRVETGDVLVDLERVLRVHASKSMVSAERVRRYCQEHHRDARMELAVLHTALTITKPDVLAEALIRRLVSDARRSLADAAESEIDVESLGEGKRARGGTLTSLFLGTLDHDGERLRWRSLSESQPVSLDSGVPADAGLVLPVGGTLTVEGTLRTKRHAGQTAPIRVRSTWNVARAAEIGLPGAALARRDEEAVVIYGDEEQRSQGGAWQANPGGVVVVECAGSFAAPLDSVVSAVGESALGRFAIALPRLLSTLLEGECKPTFATVERVLRLGRLSSDTRVYLLYWRRLRDYLMWSVRDELAGSRG